MKWIYILGLVVFTLGACKKDDKGASNVEINFTFPMSGDTIASYNQVHAEGTISGDGTMRGYRVYLLNAQNSALLYSNSYEVESKGYNFHEHWTNNLSDTTNVIVRVEVIKDKDGNKATNEINVVCLP